MNRFKLPDMVVSRDRQVSVDSFTRWGTVTLHEGSILRTTADMEIEVLRMGPDATIRCDSLNDKEVSVNAKQWVPIDG